MSPFIAFQYTLAIAGGVMAVGMALRVLRVIDLSLKALLAKAPAVPKERARRVGWLRRKMRAARSRVAARRNPLQVAEK